MCYGATAMPPKGGERFYQSIRFLTLWPKLARATDFKLNSEESQAS